MAESMALDLLTVVPQSIDEELLPVASLFTGGFDHTSVLMVTGPMGPSSRVGAIDRMTIVRIGHGASAAQGITLMAETASEFVHRWRTTS